MLRTKPRDMMTNASEQPRRLVAASDSSAESKARAGYIGDGIADNIEIQAAIDGLSKVSLRDKFGHEEWFLRAASYWESRFRAVQGRLVATFRYVEFHAGNRDAFSYEFASILRDAGSIFGSVADAVTRGAGVASKRRRADEYSFPDYRHFLLGQDPDLPRRTVDLRPLFPASVVVPFEELTDRRGIPRWWDAYNGVKHREYDEFPRGNLENSVTAVCALALLGNLMATFVSDDLFVNVGVVRHPASIDLANERRLFPTRA